MIDRIETRIKVSPTRLPSAFGDELICVKYSSELNGRMLAIYLENKRDTIEIRCTPEFAESFAKGLRSFIISCAEERKEYDVIG